MVLNDSDINELQHAKNLLANPGLAAKITNFIGSPIEKGLKLLPEDWNKNIGSITQTALTKSAEAALYTLDNTPHAESSNLWHKFGVAVSGGIGGFFGLAALTIELPISTTIMLRSIADIARSEGESISSNDTKSACLEVFALGGASDSDDSTESGYYAVRSLLARSVTEASEYALEKAAVGEAAPALIRFIAVVAERFGIQVTEKAAAQLVPAIGAAGGAIINTLFIDHFQDMARGHFIVRKLERKYGKDVVKSEYLKLPNYATIENSTFEDRSATS